MAGKSFIKHLGEARIYYKENTARITDNNK